MKFIRSLITFLLAAVILALGIAGGALFSVRQAYSEESVRSTLSEVSWAALDLPYEGENVTLAHAFNDFLSSYRIPSVSEEDFNKMIAAVGADALITDYIADFSNWFFEDGERPTVSINRLGEMLTEAAGVLLGGGEKTEVRLPAEGSGIIFLSQKSGEEDIDAMIDGYQLPPDYAAALKELAKEYPAAELSELMALLDEVQNGNTAEGESAADLPLTPEDTSLEDLLGDMGLEDLLGDGNLEELLGDMDLSELLGSLAGEENGELNSADLSSVIAAVESLLTEQITNAIQSKFGFLAAADELNEAFDELEPYKPFFSASTLRLLLICLGVLAVILLLVNLKTPSLGLPSLGLAGVLAGLLFLGISCGADFIPPSLFRDYQLPEVTLRLAVRPLLASLKATGTLLASGGGCLVILGGVIGAVRKLSAKGKKTKA